MSARLRGAVAALAAAAVATVPDAARACSVCGAGNDRSNLAFLISTIFLSLLPLALIGGGVVWLRRHASGEFAEREDPVVATGRPAQPGRASLDPVAPQRSRA